ncbi:hypothetical protein GA0115244_100720 [Streptomyces sp. DvalAA-19]|nr:hypothetical protein GA0115244_100720 [Streptomyces sp. DvalAA-19]
MLNSVMGAPGTDMIEQLDGVRRVRRGCGEGRASNGERYG